MFLFEFKYQAARELEHLPLTLRKRILEKLKFYASQDNPLKFARRLRDRRSGEYRFRIGDYRLLCDVERGRIIVLKFGHRRNIYRDC